MANIRLKSVTRVFSGGMVAVDSLDLDVQDEELLVLVGPSGCGKSTTLRMIAGLESPTSGEIFIGGRKVNDVPARHRDIAMVFQNYALYPHLNVRRNLSFGWDLRCGGWLPRAVRRIVRPAKARELETNRSDVGRQVQWAAETLGIEPLLGRMPRELSGGERQRVALGRAIVRRPAVFLLDEPLSNLDARLRVQLRHELKQLHQRLRATMIYVTHDQIEAMTLGDRMAVMHEGRLQQIGTPMEIYDRPRNRFVGGFIGAPMNFVEGELTCSDGKMAFLAHGVKLSIPDDACDALRGQVGRKTALGVRPEDVKLEAQGAWQATVSLVEPLGDAALVHLVIAGADNDERKPPNPFAAKTDARRGPQAGERVSLRLNEAGMHWFDASGENLMVGRT